MTDLLGRVLLWPVRRSSRTFRIYVVEPPEYAPEKHVAIFNATLRSLITPSAGRYDRFETGQDFPPAPFDLVTFPEAFFPADKLIETLKPLAEISDLGCVHVGLRSGESKNHLMGRDQIRTLVDQLSHMDNLEASDLAIVNEWVATTSSSQHFNVGCVFTRDADAKIRICLHPKMVRARIEVDCVQERHMDEGKLLALITLVPTDKRHMSVTLQPLLCSDALAIDTDSGNRPLDAANSEADCFNVTPPDHIDLISIAACTPQQEGSTPERNKYLHWQQEFTDTFRKIGTELTRHYHSVTVLANFRRIDSRDGGLSGIFVPVPQREKDLPEFCLASNWGRPMCASLAANHWSIPSRLLDAKRSTLGYVVQLDPDQEIGAHTRVFGFTLVRFPRDVPRWRPEQLLAKFQTLSTG